MLNRRPGYASELAPAPELGGSAGVAKGANAGEPPAVSLESRRPPDCPDAVRAAGIGIEAGGAVMPSAAMRACLAAAEAAAAPRSGGASAEPSALRPPSSPTSSRLPPACRCACSYSMRCTRRSHCRSASCCAADPAELTVRWPAALATPTGPTAPGKAGGAPPSSALTSPSAPTPRVLRRVLVGSSKAAGRIPPGRPSARARLPRPGPAASAPAASAAGGTSAGSRFLCDTPDPAPFRPGGIDHL